MITKFILPRLSETSDSAKIAEWYVRKGEAVHKGQPLVAVESDKATIDIESPADGFVCQILLQQGEIGQALAVLALIGESAAEEMTAVEPGKEVKQEKVRGEEPRQDSERHLDAPDTHWPRI